MDTDVIAKEVGDIILKYRFEIMVRRDWRSDYIFNEINKIVVEHSAIHHNKRFSILIVYLT